MHLTTINFLHFSQLRLIAMKKKRMETCRLLLGLILWPEPQMIISMKSIFHTIFDTTILIMHQAPRTLPKRLSSKFFYVICNIWFRTISFIQLPITLANFFFDSYYSSSGIENCATIGYEAIDYFSSENHGKSKMDKSITHSSKRQNGNVQNKGNEHQSNGYGIFEGGMMESGMMEVVQAVERPPPKR